MPGYEPDIRELVRRRERFRQRLKSLDEATLARIDAAVADGNPASVAWDEDPDPFGMDWRWLIPPRRS